MVSDSLFAMYVNNQIGCGVPLDKIIPSIPVEPTSTGFADSYFQLVADKVRDSFVKESLHEVLCRRILTDTRLSFMIGEQAINLHDFVNGIRNLPEARRAEAYKTLIASPAFDFLVQNMFKFTQGEHISVCGWLITTPNKMTRKQASIAIRESLQMACLLDPLSLVFVEAVVGTGVANCLDLPDKFIDVLDALHKLKYKITSIKNWAFAQTFPYADVMPLMGMGIYAGLDQAANWFVLSQHEQFWLKMTNETFEASYTNGLLKEPVSFMDCASFGWEGVARQ